MYARYHGLPNPCSNASVRRWLHFPFGDLILHAGTTGDAADQISYEKFVRTSSEMVYESQNELKEVSQAKNDSFCSFSFITTNKDFRKFLICTKVLYSNPASKELWPRSTNCEVVECYPCNVWSIYLNEAADSSHAV